MVKIKTVIRDEDNHIQGGVNFYWVKGESTVLYQAWEHKGSGPVWKEIAHGSMAGDDFIQYLRDCWSEYTIMDVQDNYR